MIKLAPCIDKTATCMFKDQRAVATPFAEFPTRANGMAWRICANGHKLLKMHNLSL